MTEARLAAVDLMRAIAATAGWSARGAPRSKRAAG